MQSTSQHTRQQTRMQHSATAAIRASIANAEKAIKWLNGNTATTTVSTPRKTTARKATTTRKTIASAPTSGKASTPAAIAATRRTAMLKYFKQHPTASLSVASLCEVSPFKRWGPNGTQRAADTLVKNGSLTKTAAGYYGLAPVAQRAAA